MTEFAALEVFRHRYRDPKYFVEGIKLLGFTSKQFKVEVWPFVPDLGVHVTFASSDQGWETDRRQAHQVPYRPGALPRKHEPVSCGRALGPCVTSILTLEAM